ncbi:MAG: hypothetical protein J1E31_06850 [Helicobacter sp.]|nr:hypothetical protein [Helicobacter sp.]
MPIGQVSGFGNSPLYQSYYRQNENKTLGDFIDTSRQDSSNEAENKENTQNINGKELDNSEVQQVRELQQIDREVRAHEAAHIAAGGGVVSGGASFSYTKGPDDKMYATAGEVPISMKTGGSPEETIQNARQIIAAAMAPSNPSPQDYKVAASAVQMESRARIEMSQQANEEMREKLNTQDTQESQDLQKVRNTRDSQEFREAQISSQSAQMREREIAIRTYSQNINTNSLDYTSRFEIAG